MSTTNENVTKKEEKKDDSMDIDEDELENKRDRSSNTSVSKPPVDLVTVHPLVLLSVVDHYTRVARDTSKRVIGVLLGELHGGKAELTNSYAIPFEEDPKDSSSWYIDRQYHEDMYAMFKKINASEKILGWYSTGPKLKSVDLAIHEMFRAYTAHPILVLISVADSNQSTGRDEIPTLAYVSIESSPLDQHSARRQFSHVPSQIGANEAEEVGVEHLLRNLRDSNTSSLTERVKAKIASLQALKSRLTECEQYLSQVIAGKLPTNLTILAKIQDMFNLMPDLTDPKLITAINTQSNDQGMVIYISSLIRSILALHDLINNKITNRRKEKESADAETAASTPAITSQSDASAQESKQKESEEKKQ